MPKKNRQMENRRVEYKKKKKQKNLQQTQYPIYNYSRKNNKKMEEQIKLFKSSSKYRHKFTV